MQGGDSKLDIGSRLWKWGLQYLIIPLLPFGLESLAAWIMGEFPGIKPDLMLWPSIPAIGFIWCAMTAIDTLSLKPYTQLNLSSIERINLVELNKFIKKIHNFKMSVLILLVIIGFEATIYGLLVSKNHHLEIFDGTIALLILVVMGLVFVLSLVAQFIIASLEAKSQTQWGYHA